MRIPVGSPPTFGNRAGEVRTAGAGVGGRSPPAFRKSAGEAHTAGPGCPQLVSFSPHHVTPLAGHTPSAPITPRPVARRGVARLPRWLLCLHARKANAKPNRTGPMAAHCRHQGLSSIGGGESSHTAKSPPENRARHHPALETRSRRRPSTGPTRRAPLHAGDAGRPRAPPAVHPFRPGAPGPGRRACAGQSGPRVRASPALFSITGGLRPPIRRPARKGTAGPRATSGETGPRPCTWPRSDAGHSPPGPTR
jgi:hypothetical protein